MKIQMNCVSVYTNIQTRIHSYCYILRRRVTAYDIFGMAEAMPITTSLEAAKLTG